MIGMALAFMLFFQGAPAARPGVVSGQLRTLGGIPAAAVRVVAVEAPEVTVKAADGTQYYTAQQPPKSTALTDTQGRYRLTNIPPGRYFIVAGVTYFPSTLDPDRATVVTVAADSNAENLDFSLLTPFGGKVSGRVNPKPAAGAQETAMLSGVNLEGILEAPISADGAFEFGHVPTGPYWVDIVPTPPGMGGFRLQVGDGDVTGLDLVRPTTHTVTGRIVVQNGPLPRAILAFYTARSHVNVPINPDGTFTAHLHSARHLVELAGMPGGYSVASVQAGSTDASQGLTVGNADVSGVVITVAAPRTLPHVKGQVTGLPAARLASTKVEVTGPINGSLETAVAQDGSFEFAALTPGNYRLRLPQVPEFTPMYVVVTWNDAQVQVAVPSR